MGTPEGVSSYLMQHGQTGKSSCIGVHILDIECLCNFNQFNVYI